MDKNSDMLDKTKDVIDKSIEDRLFEKMEEYSVLEQFSNDSISRRKIFDSLINPIRDSEKSIYPISLKSVSISYDENTNNVILGYNGNSTITNVVTKQSKFLAEQTKDNGINIFGFYEEKIM